MLRARAYGPMADIENDPAALQRLQQLEALRQGRGSGADTPEHVLQAGPAMVQAPEVDAPDTAATVPDDGAGAPAAGAAAAAHTVQESLFAGLDLPESTATDDETGRTAAPTTSRLSARTSRILWVGAIVAAAAVSAAVTYGLVKISPVAVSSGAPQIATLEASPTLELPTGWMGVGPSSAAFEFSGLLLVQSSGGYINGSTGTDCLTVVRADQVPKKGEFDATSGWSSDGPIYAGCGVGVFSATVEVPIDSNAPKELSERYPSGKALQFVFDGDRVGVFLDSE